MLDENNNNINMGGLAYQQSLFNSVVVWASVGSSNNCLGESLQIGRLHYILSVYRRAHGPA